MSHATANDQPLILAALKCSYVDLVNHLRGLDFSRPFSPKPPIADGSVHNQETTENNDTAQNTKRVLPLELVHYIVNFLTIQPVVHSEVKAVMASSLDGMHNLKRCLIDDEETWWLSAPGTMSNGRGSEFVQLRLCENRILRRVTAVLIRIPPLPAGPLSLREFQIHFYDEEKRIWKAASPILHVSNQRGLQRFEIGNIDAVDIRIVCLSNQISLLNNMLHRHMERVGFNTIQFQ